MTVDLQKAAEASRLSFSKNQRRDVTATLDEGLPLARQTRLWRRSKVDH